jgi:hypothetical protein
MDDEFAVHHLRTDDETAGPVGTESDELADNAIRGNVDERKL